MTVMIICQALFYGLRRHRGRPWAVLALVMVLAPATQGCLYLREPPPRPGLSGALVARPAGPTAKPSPVLGFGAVLAWGLSLGGLGGLWLWTRRAWRLASRARGLDREDLALLRTARDALSLLAAKQASRFKALCLRGPPRAQGPGAGG